MKRKVATLNSAKICLDNGVHLSSPPLLYQSNLASAWFAVVVEGLIWRAEYTASPSEYRFYPRLEALY